MDSSMLVPVTQTCRRLREVALAHPHLWTTFQASFENLPLIRQMEWSKHILLNALGSDINILQELPPDSRFGSIHLYDISASIFGYLRTLVEQSSSPALHSFSLFWHGWDPEEDTIPLTPEYAPNLRELAIQYSEALVDKGFPRLTHLALIDVSARNFHARFIRFITECPQLESVALSGFALNFEEEDAPTDPPSIPLQHLRHVTFHDFFPNALKYYVTLLQPRVPGSSIQVLAYHAEDRVFPLSFLLPPHSDEPEPEAQTRICIGVHPPNPTDTVYAISLTTITFRSTRHLASWNHQLETNDITPSKWPSTVLSQSTTSTSPLAIDEVWLYGVGATTFPRPCSPLAHFPNARRVVIAVDRRFHYNDAPTLHLLPSTRDPSCGPIGITTLRIVPLGQLIQDFRSGGYGYIKHLVLQVTPHIGVDEKELDELRNLGHFETFRFERIEEFPDMPGHSDPARWGCERYPVKGGTGVFDTEWRGCSDFCRFFVKSLSIRRTVLDECDGLGAISWRALRYICNDRHSRPLQRTRGLVHEGDPSVDCQALRRMIRSFWPPHTAPTTVTVMVWGMCTRRISPSCPARTPPRTSSP
ncbi:hypothetical protein LXA43DRAFT_1041274 [Ganoderma leucocontextum]|nr:hypothetical protein LXA43DRAFT_1041274 [Ganoderma leucocontextum]